MALQQSHRERGFSLLEVLVAFSIFSVAIAIIYQIYAKGSTAAILAEEYATAVAIAESRLATATIIDEETAGEDRGTEQAKYQLRVPKL